MNTPTPPHKPPDYQELYSFATFAQYTLGKTIRGLHSPTFFMPMFPCPERQDAIRLTHTNGDKFDPEVYANAQIPFDTRETQHTGSFMTNTTWYEAVTLADGFILDVIVKTFTAYTIQPESKGASEASCKMRVYLSEHFGGENGYKGTPYEMEVLPSFPLEANTDKCWQDRLMTVIDAWRFSIFKNDQIIRTLMRNFQLSGWLENYAAGEAFRRKTTVVSTSWGEILAEFSPEPAPLYVDPLDATLPLTKDTVQWIPPEGSLSTTY